LKRYCTRLHCGKSVIQVQYFLNREAFGLTSFRRKRRRKRGKAPEKDLQWPFPFFMPAVGMTSVVWFNGIAIISATAFGASS
jgi:hypothetical protein